MRQKEIAAGVGRTDGKGLWSSAKKTVHFILEATGTMRHLSPPDAKEDRWTGSLNAYFLPEEWDTSEDGLIYTDKLFLKSVKDALRRAGLEHWDDIGYSEQGAQGGVGFHRGKDDNYVNFDAGSGLARELAEKNYAQWSGYAPSWLLRGPKGHRHIVVRKA